jgi:hypothetical protein
MTNQNQTIEATDPYVRREDLESLHDGQTGGITTG